MNRREILAGVGASLSAPLCGCLSGETSGNGSGSGGDAVTPNEPTPPSDGACSPAERPLSALLTDETGDPTACPDRATPSLAIESERAASITVDVGEDDEGGFSETYELDPDERIVEGRAFDAATDLTGTVSVDGEETAVAWPERSCYRHGIAVTSDGVEIGWIEPLSGPGDTQHDCYAGDEVPVEISLEGEARTVEVTVTDLCADDEATQTLDVVEDGVERIDGLLANGGRYDLEASVDGGNTETYEFREACWGVSIGIDEDGDLRIDRIAID